MTRRGAWVLLVLLLLPVVTGIALAQEPLPPGPPGPSGPIVFGLDQNMAMIVGLVLVLVFILAIVAVSRGGGGRQATT